MKYIQIFNARINNLKGIDITIPKNKITVITGISGSGKSSLAFDLLFEAGRKQYLEYVGIFANPGTRESYDLIKGLGPTVAVNQRLIKAGNPRSVVGTKTGILQFMALLFIHEGRDKEGGRCHHLSPGHFSFNSPLGMCTECCGRGSTRNITTDVVTRDLSLSVLECYASAFFFPGKADHNPRSESRLKRRLEPFLKKYNLSFHTPLKDLTPEALEAFLYNAQVTQMNLSKTFIPVQFILNHRLKKIAPGGTGTITQQICPACQGFRLNGNTRAVSLHGKHIGQFGMMPLHALHSFFTDFNQQTRLSGLSRNVVKEIITRLTSLLNVNLEYLTLYRELPSLSSGEIHRLSLSSYLASSMESLIYIFDEPTSGLHESEKQALLKQIEILCRNGNTIIIVEHDKNAIERADHIIDLGPDAGKNGGFLVYQGDYRGLLRCPDSRTGRSLLHSSGLLHKETIFKTGEPGNRKQNKQINYLHIHGVKTNNLKNITLSIPLAMCVGIAGVSGSGKSSLITDTLVPAAKNHFRDISSKAVKNPDGHNDMLSGSLPVPGYETITGFEYIDGIFEVRQEPIGRKNNSIPLTYLGIWNKIRALFAGTEQAGKKGFTAGFFSFNSRGACSSCRGNGYLRRWLGDIIIESDCPECSGNRYRQEILEITYRGKNIHDILSMSFAEAAGFFKQTPSIHRMIRVVNKTGLDYLVLGQSLMSLSGGELQRIKLAKELIRKPAGSVLYVFDEPTTGLSYDDINTLLGIFDELLCNGNSIIIIEHDPVVLAYCDYIIELGPGSGDKGGRIIAQGSPGELRENPHSVTGPFLYNRNKDRV